MSLFYNAFFIKTPATESNLKDRFSQVSRIPDSEWVVCDFGDSYLDGLFEPGTYFTTEISLQFGETIFICVDTSNDQLEYEHSKEGNILRKLCWSFDGCQSTWEWVEGEPEPWEDLALFSEENFDRAREIFKYNEHLELLAPEELLAKEKDLRTIWDHRQYMLGDQWPLGDATIGISIQKYFGLKSPLDDLEESAF